MLIYIHCGLWLVDFESLQMMQMKVLTYVYRSKCECESDLPI